METTQEVCNLLALAFVKKLTDVHPIKIEQRKAALRRVEMELDEADELVRPSNVFINDVHNPSYTRLFTHIY